MFTKSQRKSSRKLMAKRQPLQFVGYVRQDRGDKPTEFDRRIRKNAPKVINP